MKNSNEMANSLFERRERYEAEQKRKRFIITRIVTSICCLCLVALLGFGVWQSGLFKPTVLDGDNASLHGTDKTNESKPNNNETITQNDNNSQKGEQADDLQDKKIIITPNVQNVTFYFTSPTNAPKDENKTYLENKRAKREDYTDVNITQKNITFLGKEFQNVPYTGSSKNPYKNRDEDIFANKDIDVRAKKSGEITSFYAYTPLHIFPDETKNSIELAKKFLNMIIPGFEYDEVAELKLKYSDTTWYSFDKMINGIPTSESVTIGLNSKGEFKFFTSYDIGKYDNIEITGIDKEVYLKKVDEIVKNTYGDTLKGYRIGDDGPVYEIYNDNKLELSIPIAVDTITSQGRPISFGEYIVLELN